MKHPGMINSVVNDRKDIFEWSEDNFFKVKKIIAKYPSGREQSAVIPLLDLAQRQNKGWLNKKAIEKVAETLNPLKESLNYLQKKYLFQHKPVC